MEATELIELYFEKGWTDGLPVVPPNEGSVQAMLAEANLQSGEVVGEISHRNTQITAEKVAINAVMAGCLPEYMPVVVSAVKGLCHEDYGYHGPATSTGGASMVIIINGPIAQKLGINAQDNAFGPGFRANMTIGRALRLVMMNAINTRPGKLDRSTLGTPGKLSFCFAENEADSAWQPLHVERGYREEENTTTIFAAETVIPVYNQLSNDPAPLLLAMADTLSNAGSMNIIGQSQAILVFAGEHMRLMKSLGWSKQQIKEYVYQNATRSIATLKRAGRWPGTIEAGDESNLRHAVTQPDDLVVISAGGRAGSFSACLPGWGSIRSTRTITTPIDQN